MQGALCWRGLRVLAALRVEGRSLRAAAVAGLGVGCAVAAADEGVRVVGRGLQRVSARAAGASRTLLPSVALLTTLTLRALSTGLALGAGGSGFALWSWRSGFSVGARRAGLTDTVAAVGPILPGPAG